MAEQNQTVSTEGELISEKAVLRLMNYTKAEAEGKSYTLPVASDSILGGVKIGSGLNIDSNGILTTSNSNENTSNISFQRLDTTEISKNKYSINTDYGLIYIQLTRFISEGSGSPFGTNYCYTFMIDASNFEAYAEESPGTYYHVLTQGDITLKLSHGPGSNLDNAELQNITAEIIDNDDNTWHLTASVLTT